MIDLHMHTTYSDGADSLIEVLKKAEELNLEYISITDHDTCKAYEELENLQVDKYYAGKIIPGIEIKCTYNKRLIEVLGYNVNTTIINNYMKEYSKTHSREKLQQKYFNILYERCKEIGLVMSNKEDIDFDSKKDWASVKIYQEIKSHQENRNKLPEDLWGQFTTFSKKYCGDINDKFYIDKSQDYMSVQEAIDLIKKAGGLVFLPHIFIYKWTKDKIQLLKDLLNTYSIDGIECIHSEFSEQEIEYLLDFARKNNYYISGGSDYQGINKQGIGMAVGKGNLKISSDLIKDWIKC